MEQYFIDPERVGDEADMLARGAAETDEAVALRDVMAARDGNALDHVRHLLDRDGEQAFGERFGRDAPDLVSHGSYVYTHSFPSGHSMLSAATFLTTAAILSSFQTQRRAKALPA